MEELKQPTIPDSSQKYMTEEQVRALISESLNNLTDVVRVKKQILVGDKFIIDGSTGVQKIKDSDGNVVVLIDANG